LIAGKEYLRCDGDHIIARIDASPPAVCRCARAMKACGFAF
jgi:hypothetical protein